jgi:carboxylesterase type B
MLTSHFTFQDDTNNILQFTPVVENHVGEGDEAFLTYYPKNILLSKDLELVPWMVGLTSSEGTLFSAFVPDLFQAGETKLVHQKHLINFCHLENVMVTITKWACHLKLFLTTVIKLQANH